MNAKNTRCSFATSANVARTAPDRPDQQGDECVAGDGARVVPLRERAPVGVGGQSDRQKEKAEVVQPDEGLRDQVRPSRGAARGPFAGVHAAEKREQSDAGDERRQHRADRATRRLAFEKHRVGEEERREDDQGRLRKGTDGQRQKVEQRAPREGRALIEDEGEQKSDRGKKLGSGRDEIHRLRVRGVDAEERRREEGQPLADDRREEEDEKRAGDEQERDLRRVKRERLEAVAACVIDGQ
jgi:hypothetical protein